MSVTLDPGGKRSRDPVVVVVGKLDGQPEGAVNWQVSSTTNPSSVMAKRRVLSRTIILRIETESVRIGRDMVRSKTVN